MLNPFKQYPCNTNKTAAQHKDGGRVYQASVGVRHERVRQCFREENTSAKFSCLTVLPVTVVRAVQLLGAMPGTIQPTVQASEEQTSGGLPIRY